MVAPWYIAVEPFSPSCGDAWVKYIDWCGLTQLVEVISLDRILCPPVIKKFKKKDWLHNVREDYLIDFFVDLDYLQKRVSGITPASILAAVLEPQEECGNAFPNPFFEFKGYDILDTVTGVSALTDCGGFPRSFQNDELSCTGLIPKLSRAVQVRASLAEHYPAEDHAASCDIWALWQMKHSVPAHVKENEREG